MGIIISSSSSSSWISKYIRSQCHQHVSIEVTCQMCMSVDYAQLTQQDAMLVFEIT